MERIEGTVVSGSNAGRYYVSKYNPLFKKKIGKQFFPGTLNVKTKGFDLPKKGVIIKPDEGKNVACYNARLNNIDVMVVYPLVRRDDPNVIEIVSEKNLKKELGLKNGDRVTLRFLEE